MKEDATSRRIPAYAEQITDKFARWGGLGLGMGLGIAAVCLTASAQVPPPALTIDISGTNQVLVQITNAVGSANYEIYRTAVLGDPIYPWTLHSIGSMGQSNFTLTIGTEPIGFFQVGIGSDWDGDGVPNYADALPSSGSVGFLTISITSPVNGSIFN